eukprot:scaffold45357_cov22-Tisochrysis_lutea.AAC.2
MVSVVVVLLVIPVCVAGERCVCRAGKRGGARSMNGEQSLNAEGAHCIDSERCVVVLLVIPVFHW